MATATTSIREAFVETFSQEMADNIEDAAEYHANGINDGNKGSDPFKWALLICIGYECMSNPGYAVWHKINPEAWPSIKQWMIENADLGSHDGDSDYLALASGAYGEYVGTAS